MKTNDVVMGVRTKLPSWLVDGVGVGESLWFQEVVERVETFDQIKGEMMGCGLSEQEADAWLDTVTVLAKRHLDEKAAKMRALKMARLGKKTENRIQYGNTPVFRFYNTQKEENWVKGFRWHFDRQVRGRGLIDFIVGTNETFALPLLVDLKNEDGEVPDVAVETWRGAIDNAFKRNWLISKRKLLVNRNSVGYKKVFGAFGHNAVELNAYLHGLTSAVVPGGFAPNCRIRLTTIKDHDGLPTESDGSGRIHPLHPLFQQMGRATAYYPIQIRFLNDLNTFGKGILVPDERCVGQNGEPEIWMDWLQVKGRNKAAAKKARAEGRETYTTGDLGVINVWDEPGTIDWSFEQLENIKVTPETKQIITDMVVSAMQDLQKGGVMKLAERASRDDRTMQLMLRVVYAMRKMGHDVSPMDFPVMRNQIEQKLGRTLWWISQGAGQTMERFVAVQDNSVKPGTIVLGGYRPGQKLATMRYPVVLSQVLRTLEVAAPNPHHMVEGRVVPWVAYMNAADLTGCLMGDDDGDTIGVSADPNVLKLWGMLIDNQRYAIEPTGEAMTIDPHSPEGVRYMAEDHRDNVGALTIMRAKLLAVGDIRGAVAISCLIQEAIDRAKRIVRWTDWEKAANMQNWKDEDGTLHYRGPRLEGELNMNLVAKWVNGRVGRFGNIPTAPKTGDAPRVSVLGWRSQFNGKRVNPATWQGCAEYGNWNGGNLVHHCNDTALTEWRRIESEFRSTATRDIADLFGAAIKSLEVTTDNQLRKDELLFPEMDWDTYSAYRHQFGVDRFAEEMRACMSKDDEADRILAIQDLIERRAEEMREMVAAYGEVEVVARQELMWRMENRHQNDEMARSRPDYIVYAIAFPGSPILEWLGIQSNETGCSFLTVDRIRKIVGGCVSSPDPIKRLIETIDASTLHEKEVKDEEGEGVPGWACQECCDRLTLHLVRSLRRDRSSAAAEQAKQLRAALSGRE